MLYKLIYDADEDNRNISEVVECSWDKLQEIIKDLKEVGYYNIDATAIEEEE